MQYIHIFHGVVDNGRPRVENDAEFRAFLQALEGRRVEIYIRPCSDKYAVLSDEFKHGIRSFIDELSEPESVELFHHVQSGYDVLDVVRELALHRIQRGEPLSQFIQRLYSLAV